MYNIYKPLGDGFASHITWTKESTYKKIREETKFDDFVDYLKLKEIEDRENDCILNTETQPIPPSGKGMYGGSSYKRTPKKHRKRN